MRFLAQFALVIGVIGVSVSATWWAFRERLAAAVKRQKELKNARMQGRLDREAEGPPGLTPPKPWKD